MTEAEELFDIYKLKVISIPTNREMIRKDKMIKFLELRKKKTLQFLIKLKSVMQKVNLYLLEQQVLRVLKKCQKFSKKII